MDPLTHALSGAVTARAAAPARPGTDRFTARERLLLGAAAALFPDSDYLIRLFADELSYLNLHRGVTHSLIMLPLWAMLLGCLAARYWPRQRDWREASVIIALAMLIHIAGDFITNYGTQLFAPLSSVPLAFPSTFIIDPWISLILLLGVGMAWRSGRRLPARLGLGLVVALVLFQSVMKLQAQQVVAAKAEALGYRAAPLHVMPQPLSPLHWRLVIETPERHMEAHLGFLRGVPAHASSTGSRLMRHWRAFRPANALEWRVHERFGDEFAREAWAQPEFAAFRRFAVLPYWVESLQDKGARCAVFTDLRFRTEGLDRTPFRFAMCRDEQGRWQRRRMPW